MNHGPSFARSSSTTPPVSSLLNRVQATLHAHPRRVMGAVLTLLLGTGVTAFGVAPLTAVDTNPIVQHLVTEKVQPLDVPTQIEAIDLHALTLHRTDLTRSSDTLDALLSRLGLDDDEAAQWLRRDPNGQTILQGRAGKQVSVTIEQGAASGGRLAELVVRGPAARSEDREQRYSRLSVRRENGQLVSQVEELPLGVQQRLASGTIESSLFAAADDAQIPDAVTVQMAEIFGSDIDFRRELRKGDHFAVVYEALTAEGEPISWAVHSGRVLAARFINKGEMHEAYWFQQAGQRGGYYSADGQSKSRLFLASPLAFSRVTSGFAMRFHPIQKTWKAHLGVDYGAPTGTPVRAVGDAVVSFAGRQNGYGNVIHLQHAGNRETVYAHLSRIDVKLGQRVAQSDTIGAVGATGWATGPHLHFEFKLAGQQTDPVKIARASESVTLSAATLPQFMALRRAATEQLVGVERAGVVLARME
jgi:murein DD-endopeptidase MepM/ murein hydrolase activator NlpD